MSLAAILAPAAGTCGFRLAGPLLHGRGKLSARVQQLLSDGATVLLVALLATAAGSRRLVRPLTAPRSCVDTK